MSITHTVKSVAPHFDDVCDGSKTAELRLDDRGYAVGDLLCQREWHETGGYTGRFIIHKITHKLVGGPWLVEGYCMLSLERMPVSGDF